MVPITLPCLFSSRQLPTGGKRAENKGPFIPGCWSVIETAAAVDHFTRRVATSWELNRFKISSFSNSK
jgi:hypothetical protein